jgi:hypothetical protein
MGSDVSCKEWALWNNLQIALPSDRQPSLDQLRANSFASQCLGHASVRERDPIPFEAILGECNLIAELNLEPICACIVANDEAQGRHVDQRPLHGVRRYRTGCGSESSPEPPCRMINESPRFPAHSSFGSACWGKWLHES